MAKACIDKYNIYITHLGFPVSPGTQTPPRFQLAEFPIAKDGGISSSAGIPRVKKGSFLNK